MTEFTLTYDYNAERNAKQIELPKQKCPTKILISPSTYIKSV